LILYETRTHSHVTRRQSSPVAQHHDVKHRAPTTPENQKKPQDNKIYEIHGIANAKKRNFGLKNWKAWGRSPRAVKVRDQARLSRHLIGLIRPDIEVIKAAEDGSFLQTSQLIFTWEKMYFG
jgi:hypothetical protein